MNQVIVLELLVPLIKLGFITMSATKIPLGGVSVADILAPLLTQPVRQENGSEVFRLALPEGQGLDLPLPVGRLGFFNSGGELLVTVPAALEPMLRSWGAYQQGELGRGDGSVTGRFAVRPGLEGRVQAGSYALVVRAPRA